MQALAARGAGPLGLVWSSGEEERSRGGVGWKG